MPAIAEAPDVLQGGATVCCQLTVSHNNDADGSYPHAIPSKVDAQRWLWYLRRNLINWQVYCPSAVW